MSEPRPVSDALLRFQVRAQNDPRRYGRLAGLWCAVLFFLAMIAGFLFGAGGIERLPLFVVLGLVVALLVGLLLAVTFTAVAFRRPGRTLPPDTEPADVRAARAVRRSGELSGRPEVDLIARIEAEQVLANSPRPGTQVMLFSLLAGVNLFNAVVQYQAQGGWTPLPLFILSVGVPMLVIALFIGPLTARTLRRAKALIGAYDTAYGGSD